MPLRVPTVERGRTFDADVEALRSKYPAVDSVIERLSGLLKAEWNIPHAPIDPDNLPDVYGTALDYPELGSAGRRVLFVTYHATGEAENKMRHPLRRYTLMTLT